MVEGALKSKSDAVAVRKHSQAPICHHTMAAPWDKQNSTFGTQRSNTHVTTNNQLQPEDIFPFFLKYRTMINMDKWIILVQCYPALQTTWKDQLKTQDIWIFGYGCFTMSGTTCLRTFEVGTRIAPKAQPCGSPGWKLLQCTDTNTDLKINLS